MMHTSDYSRSENLRIGCVWTVKERDPRTGLYIPKLSRKNLFTDYGLQALSGALSGGYVAPQYLVIETNKTTVLGTFAPGASVVTLVARVDQAGDTAVVLSAGTGNSETCAFSSVTANGPNFDYHLTSPTTKTHSAGDIAVRSPRTADLMSGVVGEAAYDPVNAPSTRQAVVSSYIPGAGQTTYQFYFTGIQANVYFALLGLSDSPTVGAGNLHNHVAFGYDHTIPGGSTSTNDLEIDATLTIVNN